MSGAFTAQMGTDAKITQLNVMRDELIQRFKANEEEHERLRVATEAVKDDVVDLRGRLSGVPMSVLTIADQARLVLEKLIVDLSKAMESVRGEGLLGPCTTRWPIRSATTSWASGLSSTPHRRV